MGNISDYIAWRGDITFKQSPFNHVDSLILCQLLYARLDTIVSDSVHNFITLAAVSKIYSDTKMYKENLGALINDDTGNFLVQVGKSERFSEVKLFAFENSISKEAQLQFAAMSALLPTGELCIIFRGTDDTIVGWKEDFNMSFISPIPSQVHAVQYVHKICAHHNKKTFLMGHSKGGNLAVYASSFCDKKISKRITTIYDNDGPGFLPEVCEKKCFIENSKRVHSVIPEASIVGILLTKKNNPRYIKSSEKSGILQHDIFSWQIVGTELIQADKQDITGVVAESTVATWLTEVSIENRKKFIDQLYDVLCSTGANTLLELTDDWVKSSVVIIKTMNNLDKKTKDGIYAIIKILLHAVQINLPPLKDFFINGQQKINSK